MNRYNVLALALGALCIVLVALTSEEGRAMTTDNETLRAELVRAMKRHDWSYERADDPRAFREGEAQERRINSLVEALPDGVDVYNANRPAHIEPMVER